MLLRNSVILSSGFSQVSGLGKVLYKYVTAERILTCPPSVGNRTLRATQPAALNDPFECATRPVFVINDTEDANERFAEVLSSINGTTPVRKGQVAQAWNTVFI